MKKSAVLQYPEGSAERVIAHAHWQYLRGRKPAMPYKGELNPGVAVLRAVRDHIVNVLRNAHGEEFAAGSVLTIARQDIGGLRYTLMYDEGNFINVRLLTCCCQGLYKCTTRDCHGQHLGPGGGWIGESVLFLAHRDLEPLRT